MGKKKDIKFIDYLQRKFGLSDDQREILHDEITGKNLSKRDITKFARNIKRQFPNK
jgi:hypothetical protein